MINRFYLIIAFLLFASFVSAQNAILKGRITDAATNEPLPGAYIHFDGLTKGAITDAFGSFEFDKISPGEYKVKVKYVGYTEYEEKIRVSGDQLLNIKLLEKSESLKQVQVYGKTNEESDASSRPCRKKC
jgi:hypothetical protein